MSGFVIFNDLFLFHQFEKTIINDLFFVGKLTLLNELNLQIIAAMVISFECNLAI